ncbi:YdbH domain-containing protein [Altererythrobacter aquiaggeris]|uniref:YdbH domain-containing protein n=1 Tax=Aestuarierythrobacter aquiaggeris TaxID=1898396 RepID=UPI003015EDBA
MTGQQEQSDAAASEDIQRRPGLKMWRVRISLALALILIVLGAIAWSQREDIAGDIIADELAKLGIPATYDVARIGGRRQILTNVVIGDPQNPDLTIERAEVAIDWGMFSPQITRVTLTRPRLYGAYRNGRLSFGALDPLLFDDQSDKAAGLPDLEMAIIDGRARLLTDFGAVGIKAEGAGNLANSFSGIIAANAPQLEVADCRASGTTLFGKLTTTTGKVGFDGPVRLAALACRSAAVTANNFAAAVKGSFAQDFSSFDGDLGLEGERLAVSGTSLGGIGGNGSVKLGGSDFSAVYKISAQEAASAGATAALVKLDGDLRAQDNFSSWEARSGITGERLRPGKGFYAAVNNRVEGFDGTLLAPILAKARTALEREGRASEFGAEVIIRGTGNGLTAAIPQAIIRGTSGRRVLSVSRFRIANTGSGSPRISGNFSTSGENLPQISGRMERQPSGSTIFQLNMAQYSAGSSSIALPELRISQAANGSLAFVGKALASGPLPGGGTRNLMLPVNGSYSSSGRLALWNRCTTIAFDQLTYANLTLERKGLTLCPRPGGSILALDNGRLKIAAGVPSLNVAGRLGNTPIRLVSGPVGFAYPGILKAKNVDIALGPADTATRFRLTDLDAKLGGDRIAGTFAGTDVFLAAVPLDIFGAAGNWSYSGGKLGLTGGSFRLEDRERSDRFQPLVARDAVLGLENNLITAFAVLRHPGSDRVVTEVDIRHNLTTSSGYADLTVPGLVFDQSLQADQLSRLALGVVANTFGTVTGTGRIDWNSTAVTSTGQFSSENLDLAAAFGPVKGASGTVVFSDLLGLTTAPGQKIKVRSINPGIEVFDGEIGFALRNGELLAVQGGSWPFMGGTITLQPVDINIGVTESRTYVLVIEGLEAGQFVQQMEIGNLAATGTFDGRLPLIFDENGGRIEGGQLASRAPGGSISYVGELTYRDLNPIANFAFDALRSLDYQEMRVAMDGSLTGELVTRVRFDGVKQGVGARQNIITRRLAKLPIRFNINIRAPFYKLITSIKAMYDPAFVRDPRDLGLVNRDGTVLKRAVSGEDVEPELGPLDIIPDEIPIQTTESENQP